MMRGRRSIFVNRVCEFRGRRSVSLSCKRCKTKVNPLRRLCVSKRSRCGAVRMCLELGEPFAEILRVKALSLWRRASASCSRRTLCGDPACRSALAVAPFDVSAFFACEAVFGSCLVVCASAFTIARCLGFHLLGPRQLRIENRNF